MDDNTTQYTFECRESNEKMIEFPLFKNTNVSLDFDSSVRWPCVLYEFCKFLGSIYGYDIIDKIEVNGNSLGDEALEPLSKDALREALFKMTEEDNWKEPENFFMGSADDWAEE